MEVEEEEGREEGERRGWKAVQGCHSSHPLLSITSWNDLSWNMKSITPIQNHLTSHRSLMRYKLQVLIHETLCCSEQYCRIFHYITLHFTIVYYTPLHCITLNPQHISLPQHTVSSFLLLLLLPVQHVDDDLCCLSPYRSERSCYVQIRWCTYMCMFSNVTCVV